MSQPKNFNQNLNYIIEIIIRLGFLGLIIAWCLNILYPFTGVVVWGLILALALAPVHKTLKHRLGAKPKLASAILIVICLLIIIIPTYLFLGSIVEGASELTGHLNEGTLKIPPPQSDIQNWPLVGDKLFDIWTQASDNLESFIVNYQDQLAGILESVLAGISSITAAIIQFILAIIIAGVLLATAGAEPTSEKFFARLIGERGAEFSGMIVKTVRNVVKGVIGVALIQAFLIGVGLFLAEIPYAGLWTLLALIMAIMQLPVGLLTLGIIIYLFSSVGAVPATLWSIYFLAAGLSDNVLKPVLLGKGAPVPMMVIFLGVIGGFVSSGFIGLFTGAIVISIGYKLFLSWLNSESPASPKASSPY